MLTERNHRVGKATVYRTLPLLVDCGILKQVRFDVKQAHYEHAFGAGPHDHMVCRRCGRIIEFRSDEVEELRARIARRERFHVVSHRFQISGLCWECAVACPVATAKAGRREPTVRNPEVFPQGEPGGEVRGRGTTCPWVTRAIAAGLVPRPCPTHAFAAPHMGTAVQPASGLVWEGASGPRVALRGCAASFTPGLCCANTFGVGSEGVRRAKIAACLVPRPCPTVLRQVSFLDRALQMPPALFGFL